MRSFTTAVAGLAAASIVSAAPAPKNKQFPLNDNFPFSNQNQINRIQDEAFGTIPNAPPPPSLHEDTFTSLRFLNFGETLESKFFDELINNITHNVKGFQNVPNRDFTLATLKSMRATEELHTLNAAKTLTHFKKDTIQPCQYKFPVSDFDGAIKFISKITGFVEGVLTNIAQKAVKVGDDGFIGGVIAASQNEAEQQGFFRFIEGLRPNEKPFHTIGNRDLAFSLQQDLVVPGSCPNAFEIDIDIIQPLTAVNGDPPAKDGFIQFSIDLLDTRKAPLPDFKVQSFAKTDAEAFQKKYGHNDFSGLFITYLNGPNVPKSEPIKNVKLHGTTLTFEAFFPFSSLVMDGTTVAVLTNKENPTDADDATAHTVRGPAILDPVEKFPADEIA